MGGITDDHAAGVGVLLAGFRARRFWGLMRAGVSSRLQPAGTVGVARVRVAVEACVARRLRCAHRGSPLLFPLTSHSYLGL